LQVQVDLSLFATLRKKVQTLTVAAEPIVNFSQKQDLSGIVVLLRKKVSARLSQSNVTDWSGTFSCGSDTLSKQEHIAMPTEAKIVKTLLRLVTGDIAEQDMDAVVTAAHWRLNKGSGTDGTIHTKGGPKSTKNAGRLVAVQSAMQSSRPAAILRLGMSFMPSDRFGADVKKTNLNCWPAPVAGAWRSQWQISCTAFRFPRFRPVPLAIR
jgi:hypothetical protein